MRHAFIACALALCALAPANFYSTKALAQSRANQVSGAIESFQPGKLVVKTKTGDVEVSVPDKTRITAVHAATLGDIKKGDFVGSATTPGRKGSMIAVEVHIFAPSQKGTGEGSRPFPIVKNGTMTNAEVTSAVDDIQGRVLTMTYNGGEKHIVVPKKALIVRYSPGDEKDLTTGARVSVTAQPGNGGKLTATRISVGVNGARPPF